MGEPFEECEIKETSAFLRWYLFKGGLIKVIKRRKCTKIRGCAAGFMGLGGFGWVW